MQGSQVEVRVIRSLAGFRSFASDGSFAADKPTRLKGMCRWAGLGVSALDWAYRSRVEAVGLGRNWAFTRFGLKRLGRGNRRVLGSVQVARSGPRVGLLLFAWLPPRFSGDLSLSSLTSF